MIDFEIYNRFTGKVQFTAPMDATELTPLGIKKRFAVVWALYKREDLTGADLCAANLHNADLRGANLTGADLTEANLTGANLAGVNLYHATLYETKF